MKKIDPHQKITYSDELIEVTEERVFGGMSKLKQQQMLQITDQILLYGT